MTQTIDEHIRQINDFMRSASCLCSMLLKIPHVALIGKFGLGISTVFIENTSQRKYGLCR